MVVQDTVLLRADSLLSSRQQIITTPYLYIFFVVVTQINDFWKYRGFVGVQN